MIPIKIQVYQIVKLIKKAEMNYGEWELFVKKMLTLLLRKF